jgi:GNAT superfamily N-acetyltransferase
MEFRIIPLPPGYSPGGFRCEPADEPDEIGGFIAQGLAAKAEAEGWLRTFVALDEKDEPVGYFSLMADSIQLDDGVDATAGHYKTAPAIKIARLGVASRMQGQGLGKELFYVALKEVYEVGRRVGVRYITLDAVAEKVSWYENLGFTETTSAQPTAENGLDPGDRSMYFDLGGTADRMD